MAVSQKCLYAIRSIFELMRRAGTNKPVKISDIAKAQDIPVRFLEAILNELKAAGFVDSRRGADGGYVLAPNQDEITVGHIMEFVEGPMEPVSCVLGRRRTECPFYGNCVFLPMWKEAHVAITGVYFRMKIKDLVEQDRKHQEFVPDYTI